MLTSKHYKYVTDNLCAFCKNCEHLYYIINYRIMYSILAIDLHADMYKYTTPDSATPIASNNNKL